MKHLKQYLENYENNIPTISLTALNMRRIWLVCLITMLFQIVALSGEHVHQFEILRIASIVSGIVSCILLAVLTVIIKKKIPESVQNKICHFFWILFTLEMTPFIISDVIWSKSPVNIILFVAVLSMVPVFSPKVILRLYPLPMLYMVVIVYLCDADVHLFTSSIVFACAGILIAYLNQSSFYALVSKLRIQSERDQLTGMYNKATGMNKMLTLLPMCRREKKTIALFFIDIDFFKNYNDTFGHMKGDRVLIKIADSIQKILSRKTDISSRIGGEEFIILLADSNKEDALSLARKLLSFVEAHKITSGQGSSYEVVTVSIGVAMLDTTHSECDEKELFNLVNHADQLLYQAKSSGRNCVATDEGIFRPE